LISKQKELEKAATVLRKQGQTQATCPIIASIFVKSNGPTLSAKLLLQLRCLDLINFVVLA